MLDVLGRTWIEQGPPGGPARSPIFDHRSLRLDAELLMKILGRDLAQVFLGQQRDFRPYLRVIQPARVDPIQPALVERRLSGAFEGDALALALNGGDLGAGRRPA